MTAATDFRVLDSGDHAVLSEVQRPDTALLTPGRWVVQYQEAR